MRTQAAELATFGSAVRFDDLTDEAREQMRVHLLDSLGCAIAAVAQGPMPKLRAQVDEFSSGGPCTLIGGGTAAPDRAAFYNGALVRYLDFMDNYLGKKQSGHPADNTGAVLAAAEYADASGKDLLVSLALAYQVECRLLDEMPVQEKGFDHTVQLAFSVAAGVSRALGLEPRRASHAIAIAGTSVQGLVVTRTGELSIWKGLASAQAAFAASHGAFLAMRGVTGPLHVMEGFEGKGGLAEIAGTGKVDWSKETLDRVLRTVVKKYNAEVHTQTSIEALLDIRERFHPRAEDVERIEDVTVRQAYNITGSGEEAGDKYTVTTKEEADHSLPYLLAVALIDGEATPRQFAPDRIARRDVQELLRKVSTRGDYRMNQAYPDRLPARVTVWRRGEPHELVAEREDFDGFFTRPLTWEAARAKFHALAGERAERSLLDEIADAVRRLERIQARDLTALLGRVRVARVKAA